jgi:uncharacterized protein YceH (UPF0502 family)
MLDPQEARVLGCLIEKQSLTPDLYPLTLKGITAACNQKTSRHPVMDLSEEQVLKAIRGLMAKGLAHERYTAEGRVLKYSHHLPKLGGFNSQEQALLAVLLVRGAQTPGELRGRTERQATFESPAQVESALMALAERELALAKKLPRQSGEKESRWAQTLCPESGQIEAPVSAPEDAGLRQELEALKAQVQAMRAELDALKAALQ